MRKIILFSLVAFFSLSCAEKQSNMTTLILLRHAEKGNDGTEDPDLKPDGIERASRLAQILKDSDIDGIYSTNFKRSRNTVMPLAFAVNKEVQLYESFKVEEIEKMLKKHAGHTVVISGHSNNIPWIANLMIGKEEYKAYDDAAFGIMLIVSVVEKGKVAEVVRLNY